MDFSDRYAILQKIAKAEKRHADLLRQKEETEAELKSLRERSEQGGYQNVNSTGSASSHQASTVTPLTPDDKVALFIRLFRGRDDVYPKLWQNQKTGKNGYSPACSNEWIRGVCEKPRVKCGESPTKPSYR